MKTIRKVNLTSAQIIIFGYAALILLGAGLLCLPISSSSGISTGFIDALFTSTSATCVTGLVVFDTATHWSAFGQAVILFLIQIGGLGIVTITVALFMISGKKIGLMQRSTMQESISAPHVGGMVKLTAFILKTTIIIEIVGAILLMPTFVKDFGIRGVWLSFFHSISAFCNAGFDLMGTNAKFSSLTAYAGNQMVNIVIMLLIVVGGIGFMLWDDVRVNGLHIKRYKMHNKVVLVTTALLIILPAVYLYFNETSAYSGGEKVLMSAFQSITTRTAGFNTMNLNQLSGVGRGIFIILMLVGGSPGSTAGGIKTTTLAILFLSAISVFTRKDDVECFGRRISEETVKKASAILIMYVVLFTSGAFVICLAENLPLGDCLFETASAIGTVGLTLGITPGLGMLSRLVLISLMFLGRVGGLTVIFATFSQKQRNLSKKPLDKITVG